MSEPLPWSVSKSVLWATCRRQFLLRYRLGAVPATPTSGARSRGVLAHEVLATAFRAARDGIEPGSDRPGMGSYLHQGLAPMLEDRNISEETAYRVTALVAPVLDSIPVPRRDTVLAVEQRFDLDTPDGTRLVGYIDYAIRTGPDSVHVRDWKSGAVTQDPAALLLNPQLGTYVFAARERMFPSETVTAGLYSLSARAETVTVMPVAAAERAVHRVVRAAGEERAVARALRPDTVDLAYPATPGEHCSHCRFRPYCPVYRSVPVPIRPGVDVDACRAEVAETLAAWPDRV